MVAEPGLKLVVIIASGGDGDRLVRRLIDSGYPATKIGGTGGFLRQGQTTILSGVEAGEVDGVIAAVREECRSRIEFVPAQTLPFAGESGVMSAKLDVRVGGAVVFVIDVERFERT